MPRRMESAFRGSRRGMSQQVSRALRAAFVLSSMSVVAAALATYLLGQAMLHSMVALISAIVLLGAS